MMKKMISLLAVVGLLAHISAYALSEAELQEQTRLMQEGMAAGLRKGAQKGAAWGAGIGGLVGLAKAPGTYKSGTAEGLSGGAEVAARVTATQVGIGAAAGAAVGSAVGTGIAAVSGPGLRMWQVRKINNALKDLTALGNFKKLPQEQAMLFVAAYKRNVPMTKLLVNRLPDFVNQQGIWKALTKLFFNETPTSARVKRLQKLIAE